MEALLSTYGYTDYATLEEKMEQSNARLGALREIVDYIDSPSDNQLGKIVDEFIKEPDCDEHDWEKLKDYSSARYDFFTKALQKAIEEQRKAELKTKLICLLFEKVNTFFNKFDEFEKKFPGETYKSSEKAIKYGYYVLDRVNSGSSVEDILKIPFNKTCEIEKCEQPEYWEKLEEIVLQDKIGIKLLKRTVEIINEHKLTVDNV